MIVKLIKKTPKKQRHTFVLAENLFHSGFKFQLVRKAVTSQASFQGTAALRLNAGYSVAEGLYILIRSRRHFIYNTESNAIFGMILWPQLEK